MLQNPKVLRGDQMTKRNSDRFKRTDILQITSYVKLQYVNQKIIFKEYF